MSFLVKLYDTLVGDLKSGPTNWFQKWIGQPLIVAPIMATYYVVNAFLYMKEKVKTWKRKISR
jgi:hypothetical protein